MNRKRNRDQDVPRDLGTSSDRTMYDDSSEERITNSGGIPDREMDRKRSEPRNVPERGSSREEAERTSGRDDDEMMDVQSGGNRRERTPD